jgi:hypothetical protein
LVGRPSEGGRTQAGLVGPFGDGCCTVNSHYGCAHIHSKVPSSGEAIVWLRSSLVPRVYKIGAE